MILFSQAEFDVLLNVGVRLDSARARAMSDLVLCLRICAVVWNCLLPLTTQQRWFAATVWSVWNETASAARLSAGHAEDAVAAGSPAVRFVVFCHFCPLVSRDVGEACSLICSFPRNGGKVAYTEAPTLRLATGALERIQNSRHPNVGRCLLFTVGGIASFIPWFDIASNIS